MFLNKEDIHIPDYPSPGRKLKAPFSQINVKERAKHNPSISCERDPLCSLIKCFLQAHHYTRLSLAWNETENAHLHEEQK